jgi:hypothetical protein
VSEACCGISETELTGELVEDMLLSSGLPIEPCSDSDVVGGSDCSVEGSSQRVLGSSKILFESAFVSTSDPVVGDI